MGSTGGVNMKRRIDRLIFAALVSVLTLGSVPAMAQDTGFYAGFGFGQSKVKDVCVPGLTTCDDTDTALSIFGGYQFNRNGAVEIAYTDLGKTRFSGPGGSVSIDASGFEFSAVGTIPLNQQFALYGTWTADVYLDGAFTPTASTTFDIEP